jgi:hypothetical protein
VGNDDMLNIVVHKNIQQSEVIVSDIRGSNHLSFVFYLLDHLRARNPSDPVDIFTDWERFQSLASELIYLESKLIWEEGVNFTASLALAYRLLARKITLSDLKDLHGLESLLSISRG